MVEEWIELSVNYPECLSKNSLHEYTLLRVAVSHFFWSNKYSQWGISVNFNSVYYIVPFQNRWHSTSINYYLCWSKNNTEIKNLTKLAQLLG